MGKRSFQASAAGVEKLKLAFKKYGKTQDCLASFPSENSNRDKRNQIICSRQTVSKFLTGKRISKELFIFLCNELNLEWGDVVELNADHENENSDHKNENFNTVPVMNETPNNIIENIPGQNTSGEVGLITPVKKPDEFKIYITYNTINGQFIIIIPGDIDSFLHNYEQQNIWLESVKRSSGDKNATISRIERGSIKITFNVSSDGIKKLEEEPDKIILVARIICRSEGEELDLSDTDLSHVDLSGLDLSGINFSCADLTDANLENANLENADLDCADLSGANLRGANLKGTSLNDSIIDNKWLTVWKIVNQLFLDRGLRNADLSRVNLIRVNLIRADLSCANLSRANLSRANLSRANLSFANLSDADLRSANLRSADLRSANLSDANLSGANLSDADLSDTNLSGANLSGTDLRSVNLSGTDLSFANLSRANLSFANLSDANLRSADLRDANLRSADLSDASLNYTDLSDANLIRANLIGADLTGTALVFANVENAHFGSNPGIYEDAKRELKQRGAIFEDSPGDRSKVPTR